MAAEQPVDLGRDGRQRRGQVEQAIGGTALDSPSEREIAREERMKREG